MCFTSNFPVRVRSESFQGCSACEDDQIRACVYVDCDDVLMKIWPISTANPTTNAATTFKGSTSDIVIDWTGFITSLGSAIIAAGTSLHGETLSSFASQIGYQSPAPSEQIQALAASSGGVGVNRRAILSDHRRQSATRLSSYFTTLNLDSDASYGYSSSSDQRVCTTAIAPLSIARIARALDQYGINVILPSNVSSTTTDSQILPISTSSPDLTVTSVSMGSMSSVWISSTPESPSVLIAQLSVTSFPIGGSPSAVASSTWSTVSATFSSKSS